LVHSLYAAGYDCRQGDGAPSVLRVHSRIEEQPAARPLVKPLVFDKALVVEA
jgi:hypothetical protein